MKMVKHWSIVRNTGHGIQTTTLCNRMSQADPDGMNITDTHELVTCKICLRISRTEWGKQIISQCEDTP